MFHDQKQTKFLPLPPKSIRKPLEFFFKEAEKERSFILMKQVEGFLRLN